MPKKILKKLKEVFLKGCRIENSKLKALQEKHGVAGSLDDPSIVKKILQLQAEEELAAAIDELV